MLLNIHFCLPCKERENTLSHTLTCVVTPMCSSIENKLKKDGKVDCGSNQEHFLGIMGHFWYGTDSPTIIQGSLRSKCSDKLFLCFHSQSSIHFHQNRFRLYTGLTSLFWVLAPHFFFLALEVNPEWTVLCYKNSISKFLRGRDSSLSTFYRADERIPDQYMYINSMRRQF